MQKPNQRLPSTLTEIKLQTLLRYQKNFPINLEFKPFFLREIMISSGRIFIHVQMKNLQEIDRPHLSHQKVPTFLRIWKGTLNFMELIFDQDRLPILWLFYRLFSFQLASSGTLLPREANWLPDAKNTTEGALNVVLSVRELEPGTLIPVFPSLSERTRASCG